VVCSAWLFAFGASRAPYSLRTFTVSLRFPFLYFDTIKTCLLFHRCTFTLAEKEEEEEEEEEEGGEEEKKRGRKFSSVGFGITAVLRCAGAARCGLAGSHAAYRISPTKAAGITRHLRTGVGMRAFMRRALRGRSVQASAVLQEDDGCPWRRFPSNAAVLQLLTATASPPC